MILHRPAQTSKMGWGRAVEQWTLDGKFVQRHDNCTAAAKAVGVDKTSISGAYSGKHPIIKGFLWKLERHEDEPGEEWKSHPTIDGLKVSTNGRVETKAGTRTRGWDCFGYKTVIIKRRTHRVHRLVLETFDPDGYQPVASRIEKGWGAPQVNHKDYDRGNNHLSNLEWVTPKENCLHRHKRIKE